MADFTLDDGTEGASVGYRSYSGPAEESDNEPAKVVFEEDEDLDEEGEPDGEQDEDEDEEYEDEGEEGGLSPEAKKAVAAAVKRMERTYEKRLAAMHPNREALDIAGALQEDPKGTITALARKYGVTLVEDEGKGGGDIGELTPPGKDEELTQYIQRAIAHGVKQAMAEQNKKPVPSPADNDKDLNDRKARAQLAQRVAYLNAVYDDWKDYTEQMSQVLRKDPSLRDDLDKLYSEAKKLKQASGKDRKAEQLKRSKGKGRKYTTGERGTGRVKTKAPKGKMSFAEAWEHSKRELARRT